MLRLFAIILITAASSAVLLLLALTQGIDKALIVSPACLAVALLSYHEMLEDAATASA